jgi:NADH-quinone oxidoreductase subunit N
VDLQRLAQSLLTDTQASLANFRPELVLCATIVLILLLRLPRLTSRIDSFYLALIGASVALWFAAPWQNVVSTESLDATVNVARQPIFTGMLVYDSLTIYFRIVLLLFTVLFVIFTRISGIPDREAGPDFYTLVLGAIIGMCIMASANHMLMVFMGVEMASVPSYVLSGALKGRRQSSEAALKYAVYGAGAAGIMLYGISLLGGILGSVHLPTMTIRLAELIRSTGTGSLPADTAMVLALGGLMVMVGLSFKLAAVPFHFWCPDVFEGASAEVNAFLSVASKAAALALLIRVAVGFSVIGAAPLEPQVAMFAVQEEPPVAPLAPEVRTPEAGTLNGGSGGATLGDLQTSLRERETGGLTGPAAPPQEVVGGRSVAAGVGVPKPLVSSPDGNKALAPVRRFIAQLLAFVAVITCTFGNLAAYGQRNIKRLLAYSTIAHAGYMIMPVAAAVTLLDRSPAAAQEALGALTLYIGVYLFMNLGAFAVVAFLRNAIRSELIEDYAGLIRRMPVLVICFSLILVSLIGLPPLAGFIGKLLIFAALTDAQMWTVLVIAGLNTAISLFYYLRVIKVMTMDPEPDSRLPVHMSFVPSTFVVLLTIPLVLLGLWWNDLYVWMRDVAHLFS